jgi:KilA-N domain
MSDLILREFNGVSIRQREDGYFSLTDMAKATGREFKDWYRLDSTAELLSALSRKVQIPTSQMLQINRGNTDNRGSWGHRKVAIAFATWCSPDFFSVVIDWADEIMTKGYAVSPTATSKQLVALQNEVRCLSNARREAEERLNSVQADFIEIKENVDIYRNFILSLIDKNIRKSKGRVTYNKIFDVLQQSLISANGNFDFHTERRERILALWVEKTSLKNKVTLTTTYETTGRDGGIPGFIKCASTYYAGQDGEGDFEQWKLTELFGY